MLQDIHDKSQGWIARVILGVICFTFILWGVDRFFNGNSANTTLVKVNGEPITTVSFQNAYQQYVNQQPPLFRQALLSDPASLQQVRSTILQNLVEHLILVQAAQKQGFGVGQDLLELSLIQAPFFQEKGVFSKARFQEAIQMMGYTEDQFLSMLKNNIMVQQMQTGITQTEFALPGEVQTAIQLLQEQRAFNEVLFPISNYYPNAKITKADVQQYYDAHPAEFMLPEKVQVHYLTLSLEDLKKNIHSPEKAQAVFSKLANDLSNITFEHPDSLELAASSMHLPMQVTGYFTRSGDKTGITQNSAFVEAAFSNTVLTQKMNSDLIQISPTEIVVMHLANVEPSTRKPLAEVAAQIESQLKQVEAQKMAMAAATQWMSTVHSSVSKMSLPRGAVLQYFPLTLHTNEKIPAPLLDAVFGLSKVNSTTTVALDAGVAVVQVSDIQAGNPEKSSIAERVATRDHLSQDLGALAYHTYVVQQVKNAKIRKVANLPGVNP